MKLVFLSDTHGRHEKVLVPPSDLLLHAGDFTNRGTRPQTEAFLDWFCAQPARARVLIAGNHDYFAEREPEAMKSLAEARGVLYLRDEGAEPLGLRVWGSPVTPRFRSMAFNRDRGSSIREHWAKIPEGLDLLLTHGPPAGLCDRTFFGMSVGCQDLLSAIRLRPPRIHAFGHIHEARGAASLPGLPTQFLNVATCGMLHGVREAVSLDIDFR